MNLIVHYRVWNELLACPPHTLGMLLGLWMLALAPADSLAECPVRLGTLLELGSISGTVVSAVDGLPIQNAAAIVVGRQMGAPTNRAGQFRIDRVPLGVQTLRVMRVGFKRVDRELTVHSGENAVGTVSLDTSKVRIIMTGDLQAVRGGRVGSRVTDANLQCVVRLVDPEPTVGDALEVEARIYNLSRSEVALPMGRDGCDGTQFPRILVGIEGPVGGFAMEQEKYARNPKPLRERDFVTIKPGGSLDPLHRGWKPVSLRGRIKKPGKYRLVFQYSTHEADLGRWLTDASPKSRGILAQRLEHVPLVQLADSVSFVVRW